MSEEREMPRMMYYAQYEDGKDWYGTYIEDPLKDLMWVLRNNGINTECSCGHEMYIQCEYVLDGQLMDIHGLMNCYLHENKLPVNYEIVLTHTVMDGHGYTSLDIKLPNEEKLKKKMKKINSRES